MNQPGVSAENVAWRISYDYALKLSEFTRKRVRVHTDSILTYTMDGQIAVNGWQWRVDTVEEEE